ncbi:MAG: hypothetical protein BZY75_04045 [SAR202 cluster bacterium Io17-Chloro-G7]|nr:MAG: hypothetical protein BZY75_04045 [SAR202 cluster bacterium Io17-Chloro-G7]
MPRREDERRLNMAAKHPEACTCKECSEKFAAKLATKNEKLAQKLAKKLLKKNKKKALNEVVKAHPADCACASCALLGSIDF